MIKVNDIKIENRNFPDNTLLIKFNPDNIPDDGNDINIEWHYENDAELFTLICLKRHLDNYFFPEYFNLYLNYIPNARMDRVKSNEDVFTLKYFCEIINSLNFKTVHVRDAHSNVSLALLNNVVEDSIKLNVIEAGLRADAKCYFYPDEGAMKRYSQLNPPMPYAFGIKNRDWKTGKILNYQIMNSENVVGKNILIVDDICSRGGTFLHAAKALKEAGAADISLHVTHLEKTVFEGELLTSGLIKNIYTTNSIFPADKTNDIIKIIEV